MVELDSSSRRDCTPVPGESCKSAINNKNNQIGMN